MGNGFYVYEHIRKDTGAIFYVGKGRNERANSKHGRNIYWKRIVEKASGFDVKIIANDIDEDFAFLIEIERINQLRRIGIALSNATNGGDGVSGYVFTDEQRKAISEACKKHANKPEVKSANSKARKGVPWSEARRAACKGKPRMKKCTYDTKSEKGSAEHRKKLSIAQLNKPIVTCPHCGKAGKGSAMTQWHFDRCKEKA